jgi:Kef-type K+ transport system membrane component KefB
MSLRSSVYHFFLLILIVAAFACKMIGAGLSAHWVGLSGRDSLIVGVGMSGRGAVELIIADIALRAGLFSQPDPTLVTPIALRFIMSREP